MLSRKFLSKSLALCHRVGSVKPQRISCFSTEATAEPREAMHYDVVTVGAGPAGLSAAIRLKQLANEKGVDLSVCVVEKGAEVGAHILSGNVFEPKALEELFPDWKAMGAPLETLAADDKFFVLSETNSLELPHFLLPPQLNNDGNYIISLSALVRWLGAQAEELGVEIYPGFAASEVLYDSNGAVRGVATRDMGIAKDGSEKDTFTRGIELIARQTLFAEGCRGSCSEEVMEKFSLRGSAADKKVNVQTYGLGVKEVWQVPEEKFKKGYIQHTLGWPLQSSPFSKVFGGTFLYHMEPNLVLIGMVVGLDYENPYLNPYKEFQRWKHHPAVSTHLEGGECISYGARALNEGGFHSIPKHTLGWPLQSSPFSKVFGGTFLYHMEPNLVLIGMVVGLDYENPYLNPYKEFQRWKHHPAVSTHLEGGECISYGARALNEGGFHSIPKLTFPGGALLGCSAGFLNSVKIKGSHTAMKSGMLAAEALYPLLTAGGEVVTCAAGGAEVFDADEVNSALKNSIEASAYEKAVYDSWIVDELKVVRNTHSSFGSPLGTLGGMAYTAFSCFITKGAEPWTFANNTPDSAKTQRAKKFTEIHYPKADGILSFDLLTNLQRSGTSHDHDQPAHLRVKEHLADVPSDVSITEYAGPEQRFCPAGVYEYTEEITDPESPGCGKRHLVINAQNCVHCKCCSIKTPHEYIKWTVPEGGGGPAYTVM
jgi:flavin-dependent dehydrogenase/ferredoxin-like protein FixX